MIRGLLGVAAVGAAALLLSTGALGRDSAPVTLKGTVGPGFTISLTKAGQKVKTLPVGSYKFVVADRSSIHNFVLEKEKGGTFERAITSVGFKGTKTLTVKLTKGQWKIYCAPHEATMFSKFTVGGAAADDSGGGAGRSGGGADDSGGYHR